MGSGIATALILAGYQVLLKEVNQQFLDVSAGVACRRLPVDLMCCGW
jgi:3-hydroxyacyl-CoA dehydrogenase